VIEIVQAREQQRLAPVERAEERMLDRHIEPGGRIRGARAVEERLTLAAKDLEPRVDRSQRRVLESPPAAARRRRPPLEDRDDPAPEIGVRRDDVRQHLVGTPLLGLRPLGKARRRHRARGLREVRHRRLDLGDDLGRRLLGALCLEIPANACLLVSHRPALLRPARPPRDNTRLPNLVSTRYVGRRSGRRARWPRVSASETSFVGCEAQ